MTHDELTDIAAELGTQRDAARAALRVCGAYLATLNGGGKDGFNAACRAVESALGVDSVHRCLPANP